MNKKWGVAILSIGLLAGCSSEVSKETPKAETTQPIKEVKPSAEDIKAQTIRDMQTYSDQLSPVIKDASTILGVISKLSSMGASNPALFYNAQYLDTVDKLTPAIHSVTTRMRAIDPGSNDTIKRAHNFILKSADELDFIADNFPQAVRNVDANMINRCASSMTAVGSDMNEASNILTELKSTVQ